MKRPALSSLSLLVLFGLVFCPAAMVRAQNPGPRPAPALVVRDPGPRVGPVGAGGPIANLTPEQFRFFTDGQQRFVNSEGVKDGLGPTFNGDSCGACHSQPATGGTSPSANPQVALATAHGALNKLPFFVAADGPVREARLKFVMNPDGSVDRTQPDGSVHDLFTIRGRDDAPGCDLVQQDFLQAGRQHNLALRIPTPTFGGGLIEMIDDATILANMQANRLDKWRLAIRGKPNRSGNDGTITRFGWKAQNKSLLEFSHEAYAVELGETNQMFPQKRGFFPNPPPASCVSFTSVPEDRTNYASSDPVSVPSDDDAFSTFMRFLDQPAPSCTGKNCSSSIQNGGKLFTDVVKCALCHTPSLTTGKSSFTALSNVQANLFSDLLLHHMGERLGDGISQGKAGPDEFRTAPLWGLGQRLFFLHDGRATDLLQAIREHQSLGSEANRVIEKFNALTPTDQQDLLNFLRSL